MSKPRNSRKDVRPVVYQTNTLTARMHRTALEGINRVFEAPIRSDRPGDSTVPL